MSHLRRAPAKFGLKILALPLVLSQWQMGCSSTASDDAFVGGGPYDDGPASGGGTGANEYEPGLDDDRAPTTGADDAPPPDGSPNAAGCPDPLPAQWIFCEDFESLRDPSEVFFEYQDNDGRFVLVDDDGASGMRSLRATYEEGKQNAGWLNVVFGRNPIVYGARPHHAADQDFDEIYWRFRVKMESGWPDIGPHKLTRAATFAAEDWTQALSANVWSNGHDVTLMAELATCIIDNAVDCSGFNDPGKVQVFEALIGETPLFSNDLSGEWHCVEAHIKLNTPGVADGKFEFWVDDRLENHASDLDLRGTWKDYGINFVSLENYWAEGAPETLHRWIDDIVIATDPIGCD